MVVTLDDLTPEQVADLRHLLNLLDLLPEDDNDADWEHIGEIVSEARDKVPVPHYVVTSLTRTRTEIRDVLNGRGPHLQNVERVLTDVGYVALFDIDDEAVAEVLGSHVFQPRWTAHVRSGRRWLEDACSTVWRLNVSRAADGGL
jgi:hypothetical protein